MIGEAELSIPQQCICEYHDDFIEEVECDMDCEKCDTLPDNDGYNCFTYCQCDSTTCLAGCLWCEETLPSEEC